MDGRSVFRLALVLLGCLSVGGGGAPARAQPTLPRPPTDPPPRVAATAPGPTGAEARPRPPTPDGTAATRWDEAMLNDAAVRVLPVVNQSLIRRSAAVEAVRPRDVQPQVEPGAGAQGSGGQPTAVSTGEPTPLSAGTLAIVGTEVGPQALLALALNPLSILAKSAEEYARNSRWLDLGIVLPVNLDTQGDEDRVQSFGVRMRVNLIGGLVAGDATYERVVKAYEKLGEQFGLVLDDIRELIRTAPNQQACADALVRNDLSGTELSCGESLSISDSLRAAQSDAQEELAAARLEADRFYAGLDVRADLGDPLLALQLPQDYSIGAAVAGGVRGQFTGSRGLWGLKARLGVSFSGTTQDDVMMTIPDADLHSAAIDFGVAADLGARFGLRSASLSIGAEGRYGGDASVIDTNYTDLRIGLTVPMSDGTGANISVLIPMDGNHETVFALSGDWSLLLPD